MNQLLNQVDTLQANFKKLQPLVSEHQDRLDQKLRLEFNYNSNHIEGNTLTYGETELLLIFDKTRRGHNFREFEEMKAHDVALKLIKDWAADKSHNLTEVDIRTLNKIILVEPFFKDAQTQDGEPTKRKIDIGSYKQYPNSVVLRNGEKFVFASVDDTPIFMSELIDWYRFEKEKDLLHPVVLAAQLHYKFVRIHPFDDGNGRIARLLMNYVLLKNELPMVIIKSNAKTDYLSALNMADAGFLTDFEDYIARLAIWSLELSIKAARGESIEDPDDFDKEIVVLKRNQQRAKQISLKSAHSISEVLQSVYFLFLSELNQQLAKLVSLFSFSSWHYYELPLPPNYIVRIDAQRCSFDHIAPYFTGVQSILSEKTKKIISSFLLGSYKSFNPFNIEIRIEVRFEEENYSIWAYIGEPQMTGGFIPPNMIKLEEGEIQLNKHQNIIELQYGIALTAEELTAKAKDLGSVVLSYITTKSKEQ